MASMVLKVAGQLGKEVGTLSWSQHFDNVAFCVLYGNCAAAHKQSLSVSAPPW